MNHYSCSTDTEAAIATIAQFDGNDTLDDNNELVAASNETHHVSSRIATFELNHKKQMDRICKDAKNNDFEIGEKDQGKNINIEHTYQVSRIYCFLS